jgi:hypothetical protein
MSKLDDLRFDPPPMCERAECCDLSCVWPPADPDPLLWEGDNA